jgi:hypothetical protein
MSSARRLEACREIAPLLVFYACDEVSPEEHNQIQAHLASCPTCSKQLEEELAMQAAFTGSLQAADQLDASGAMLSQCRSELSELLDDISAPPLREHWMPFNWVRGWMASRPVWSAAFLLLMGLGVGTQVSVWFAARDGGSSSGSNTGQAVNVLAAPRLTDEDLGKMAVAGISFAPATESSPGMLRLHVRTEQPLEFSGNVDDADVRRVLTYVVANGERFDPGMRLDCLDALKSRIDDVEVRRALLLAARKDQNPAVRMKALEAMRNSAENDAVRDTLLDALQHDSNPGVRVEAVNLLVHSLESEPSDFEAWGAPPPPEAANVPTDPSVDRVIHALETLQHNDPSRYVRLRSAAALRQIGPRDQQ